MKQLISFYDDDLEQYFQGILLFGENDIFIYKYVNN